MKKPETFQCKVLAIEKAWSGIAFCRFAAPVHPDDPRPVYTYLSNDAG